MLLARNPLNRLRSLWVLVGSGGNFGEQYVEVNWDFFFFFLLSAEVLRALCAEERYCSWSEPLMSA